MSTTKPVEAAPPKESSGKGGPVIVDLGTRSRQRIRLLKRGKGKLIEELNDVLGQLKTDGTVAPNSQVVIVVVRERAEDHWTEWFGGR